MEERRAAPRCRDVFCVRRFCRAQQQNVDRNGVGWRAWGSGWRVQWTGTTFILTSWQGSELLSLADGVGAKSGVQEHRHGNNDGASRYGEALPMVSKVAVGGAAAGRRCFADSIAWAEPAVHLHAFSIAGHRFVQLQAGFVDDSHGHLQQQPAPSDCCERAMRRDDRALLMTAVIRCWDGGGSGK